MDLIVNVCVIVTTVCAFAYLCYVMVRPEQF
jgi:hypothetical protein